MRIRDFEVGKVKDGKGLSEVFLKVKPHFIFLEDNSLCSSTHLKNLKSSLKMTWNSSKLFFTKAKSPSLLAAEQWPGQTAEGAPACALTNRLLIFNFF